MSLFICMIIMMTSINSYVVNADALDTWAENEVKILESSGLLKSSLFSNYKQTLTRQEAAYLNVRIYELLKGRIVINQSKTFTDTSDEFVLKAYTVGIVNGKDEGKYDPQGYVQRQEYCKMMVEAMILADKISRSNSDISARRFGDYNKMPDWSKPYISMAVSEEYFRGEGANFNFAGTVDRQTALVVFYRAISKYISLDEALVEGKSDSITTFGIYGLLNNNTSIIVSDYLNEGNLFFSSILNIGIKESLRWVGHVGDAAQGNFLSLARDFDTFSKDGYINVVANNYDRSYTRNTAELLDGIVRFAAQDYFYEANPNGLQLMIMLDRLEEQMSVQDKHFHEAIRALKAGYSTKLNQDLISGIVKEADWVGGAISSFEAYQGYEYEYLNGNGIKEITLVNDVAKTLLKEVSSAVISNSLNQITDLKTTVVQAHSLSMYSALIGIEEDFSMNQHTRVIPVDETLKDLCLAKAIKSYQSGTVRHALIKYSTAQDLLSQVESELAAIKAFNTNRSLLYEHITLSHNQGGPLVLFNDASFSLVLNNHYIKLYQSDDVLNTLNNYILSPGSEKDIRPFLEASESAYLYNAAGELVKVGDVTQPISDYLQGLWCSYDKVKELVKITNFKGSDFNLEGIEIISEKGGQKFTFPFFVLGEKDSVVVSSGNYNGDFYFDNKWVWNDLYKDNLILNKTYYDSELFPDMNYIDKGDIYISHVQKHDHEHVEIKNKSDMDVDLEGFMIESVRGGQTYTFTESYILEAGGTVKVTSGEYASGLIWTKDRIWNDGYRDDAKLYDKYGDSHDNGTYIDEAIHVTYLKKWGTEYVELKNGSDRDINLNGYSIYSQAGGQVIKLENKVIKANSTVKVYSKDGGSWVSSQHEHTWWNNGKDNVVLRNQYGREVDKYYDPAILITELKKKSPEHVAIKNLGDKTVNLKGYVIESEKGSQKFTLDEIYIAPGETKYFTSGKGSTGYVLTSDPIWNDNYRDDCIIYDSKGTKIYELNDE